MPAIRLPEIKKSWRRPTFPQGLPLQYHRRCEA